MSEISGAGPLGPSQKKMYEQEFKHGADLFKNALAQYEKSNNPNQKAEFKDVMDKAMNVLNESAHGLMRKELEAQTQKIAQDYATFQKFSGDPNTINKLNQDLDDAKQSID
jgi:hypothetical protein